MDLYDLQALMGESTETVEYRDLWIVGLDGDANPLLGEARRMADSLGTYVHYVGSTGSVDAIAFGADRVHPFTIDSGDAAVATLTALFETQKPEFVFLPATNLGNEVAGRLAQRLNSGAVYNCIALRLDESTCELIGSHPVYDGAYYLDTALTARPAIVTVRSGSFAVPLRDSGRTGQIETFQWNASSAENRVRPLGKGEFIPPTVPLRKAAKIVAVGRSGHDNESAAIAKQIAEAIGAHFAGDRSAFDSGWITQDQIVGVIGAEVAPDVYIAAGIWGDTLHRAGVEGAKVVIAIHPDKNAPIFTYADAGIVGKPKEVLSKLLALL